MGCKTSPASPMPSLQQLSLHILISFPSSRFLKPMLLPVSITVVWKRCSRCGVMLSRERAKPGMQTGASSPLGLAGMVEMEELKHGSSKVYIKLYSILTLVFTTVDSLSSIFYKNFPLPYASRYIPPHLCLCFTDFYLISLSSIGSPSSS